MTNDHQPTPPPETEELERRCAEYLAGWQRAKADYANLKREAESREQELAAFANAGLLIRLLPTYAHLKRAIAHVPADAASQEWVQGFTHIFSQFQKTLRELGVEEVPTTDVAFDPTHHEAVAKEHREGVPADQVIHEVEPGFTLNGRLLVPAKVVVSEERSSS